MKGFFNDLKNQEPWWYMAVAMMIALIVFDIIVGFWIGALAIVVGLGLGIFLRNL